ncbi:BRCA1-associated protein [Microplitis mediator]|uniref:BRCA1-associated protein n=1 Tax=Microplitis mediator TaxID=375433 RepID=UPI002553B4F6|nr:BRCA1-associated protein [Microplitis mediator]
MSTPTLVSLCVIRIEVVNTQLEEAACEMATKKIRGRREPRNITIETYPNVSEGSVSLLSSLPIRSNKSNSISKSNSEDLPYPINVVSSNGTAEGTQSNYCPSTEQIDFFSGNRFVEVTQGILHLYKEDELTEMHHAVDRSHTVCILSVPATMTCHDLLTFTAACHQDIQHFRILQDSNPNQYMALITMRSSAAANQFYETYNGAPYNSLEPDVVCHMVFVSRVEVADNGMSLAGHTELPSCPVCLERMDESVDGILTILCNHTFHSSCLVKWGDTSCPVCRYAQTPEPLEDSHCMECAGSTSNDALWICLICGHIGCSRYHQGHAFEHYRDTHHCYAMQLGNNRVWDYVGDNFVHRLLQDKDGKMVEGGHEPSKGEGAAVDEKVDAVQLEFTYLLTSQLEKQREYFEDRLNRVEQRSLLEITELKEKFNQISTENTQIKEKVGVLTREKQSLEKKIQNSSTKLSQAQAELTEEKALRHALEQNQFSWQSKHKQLQDELTEYKGTKESEIKDMKEQIRDLMFFFEAQKKIESSTDRDNIAGGTIIIPEASTTNKPSRSRKQNRKH